MGDYSNSPTSPTDYLLPTNTNYKPTHKTYTRSLSNTNDELRSFRSYLRWMCVDQSNYFSTFLSWVVFLLLAIVVPGFSELYLSCTSCDSEHSRPYNLIMQLSLSSVASVSFVCLSRFVRKYGLRKFLFLDKLVDDSDSVRHHYTDEFNKSLKILSYFVLPCFLAKCVYKVWWYASGASEIPFLGNAIISDTVACTLELISWLYRTLVFFLVCILFRLICYLQILRLKDFANVFEVYSDVGSVLKEHLRIRKHLKIISHRYRAFILLSLILISMSQLAFLMLTTKPNSDLRILKTTELVLCSMTLVAGLLIILRSATKITHRAQGITSLAATWHACATIESYDATSEAQISVSRDADGAFSDAGRIDSDDDEAEYEEDDVDTTKFLPAYANSSISFQKRQALVTYFENNRAGITMYGFTLDRTWLQLIFGIELSLVLWLLKETITIS